MSNPLFWWRKIYQDPSTDPIHSDRTSPTQGTDHKDDSASSATGQVFGTPLRESLRYAGVHISSSKDKGDLYVWGYVPAVIAKCGSYLKERATETEGIFQTSSSTQGMHELQMVFSTPPQYGKNLDWSKEPYSVHDVVGVFRQYLTQMQEPVIPYDRYNSFREVLTRQPPLTTVLAIDAYKTLILDLPQANQYLLIYVLDLLAALIRKGNTKLTALTDIAATFQRGILSHPLHETSPVEHRLSQIVLEFLIRQHEWIMLDVAPPPPQDSVINTTLTKNKKHLEVHSADKEARGKLVGTGPENEISIRGPSTKDLVHDDQQQLTPEMANGELSEDAIRGEAGVEQSTIVPPRPPEGEKKESLPLPIRPFVGGTGGLQSDVLALTEEIEASGGTIPKLPKMSVMGKNRPAVADISHEITVVELDAVGTGGFCDLYVGSHSKHGKVALKRPRFTHAEENVLRRFRKEAELWCSFNHRCILPFLGVAQIGRHLYLVSPWVSRGSLCESLINEYTLDRSLLICDIADALLYLHGLHVVHGDVKCQNVLVNDDGHGLLCDFGLTKILGTMTTSADVKGAGSARYMAPELFLDSPKTPASDVYAFAMTIVEMISGKPPFFHIGSNHAVMMEVCLKDGRPLREPTGSKEGTSYEGLWRLIEACWVHEQALRPDMGGVVEALRLLYPATQRGDTAGQQWG